MADGWSEPVDQEPVQHLKHPQIVFGFSDTEVQEKLPHCALESLIFTVFNNLIYNLSPSPAHLAALLPEILLLLLISVLEALNMQQRRLIRLLDKNAVPLRWSTRHRNVIQPFICGADGLVYFAPSASLLSTFKANLLSCYTHTHMQH